MCDAPAAHANCADELVQSSVKPATWVSRLMRPVMMIPLGVFAVLGVGMALVEYSQHSGLMRSSALSDVAQLCGTLRSARSCPQKLSFPTRAAKDPWSHPYRCRATLRGLLLYTLGEDNALGGPRRDTDLACMSVYTDSDTDEAEPCACYVGDDATALVR